MNYNLLSKIKENKKEYEFLKTHSYWYKYLNRSLEIVQTPLYVYLTIEEASLLNEEPGEYLIYSLCQDSKDIIENLWDYIS